VFITNSLEVFKRAVPYDAIITITYKDLEGDQVTIGSEEEYKLALALHAGKNTITLSLFVIKNGLVNQPSNLKGITSNEQQKYQHPHHHHHGNIHHHGNRHYEKKEKVRKPVARFVKDVTFSEKFRSRTWCYFY